MIERAEVTARPLEREQNELQRSSTEAKHAPENRMSDRDEVSSLSIADAIVQAKMSVGPAGDAFEREADAVAARVVRSLRSGATTIDERSPDSPRVQRGEARDFGVSGDPDGEDGDSVDVGGRLRRIQRAANASVVTAPATTITRIQRAADIGAAGGDLDDDTARMLKSSRSGGRPLPTPAKSKMESAFGADFSGVRVHSGPTATELNDRIQAKAFTTGSDIYFRDSVPDVSSSSGQELLAHELTHTIQQGAATTQRHMALHRTATSVQRWPWSKKKKPAEISGPTGVRMNGGDMMIGLAAQGFHPKPIANAQIGIGGPMGVGGERPAGWYAEAGTGSQAAGGGGGGGGESRSFNKHAGSSTIEIAKPVGVGGAAGTAELATRAASDVGGASGAVVGPALLADAAMTVNSGRKLIAEGEEFNDAAATKKGNRKVKAGAAGGGAASIAVAKSGVDIANSAALAANASKDVALTTASGTLGIAAGSVMVVQGAWRGGQAVMKLCRLKWGRAAAMLSQRGGSWRNYVANREAAKVAINGVKIALGALGIAAGALALASNPIGWGIGIAAAVAGGVFAITKVIAKVRNAKEKERARKAIEAGTPPKDVVDAEAFIAEDARIRAAKESGEKVEGVKYATPGAANDRRKAIEAASEVARRASANGRIADEMRKALMQDANLDLVNQYLDVTETPDQDDDLFGEGAGASFAAYQAGENLLSTMSLQDREFHDALMILSSINVPYEVAIADSGLDLIETKLSLAEAM